MMEVNQEKPINAVFQGYISPPRTRGAIVTSQI